VWTSWQPISFSARPLNQPNFIVTTFQPTADRVFTKLYNINFTKVDNTANWTTYNVDSIESIYSISARDATEGSVIKSRIPIIIVYDNTSTTFAKGAVENYEAPAVMGITVVKPEILMSMSRQA
jgi:hypothetical protein